jgi:hypothetical protein
MLRRILAKTKINVLNRFNVFMVKIVKILKKIYNFAALKELIVCKDIKVLYV